MNLESMRTTPGYYYSIAYWSSSMLYIRLIGNYRKGVYQKAVQVLFFAALFFHMMVTDGIRVSLFLPSMFISIGIVLLLIYICCDVSWVKAGYYCVSAFIAGEFAASLSWQIFYFGAIRDGRLDTVPVRFFFIALIYPLVFGSLWLLERRYQHSIEKLQISRKELMSVLLIGVMIFAISNLSYVYKSTPFSVQFSKEIFIIRTFADLGGVAMLFAYHVRVGELQANYEVRVLQNLLRVQHENYVKFQKSVELVNQKYHDLKYQLALLRSETDSASRHEYLNRIEQEIKSYEAQNKTGNQILDVILTEKSLSCQSEGINLTVVADGTVLNFMEDMDICTLFGNALDNAMESVRAIAAQEKRLIHLYVGKQKGFIRIRIENFYSGNLIFKQGLPETTKQATAYHGFGLKSIRSTVKKYGGSTTISAENQWFELRILIPLDTTAET